MPCSFYSLSACSLASNTVEVVIASIFLVVTKKNVSSVFRLIYLSFLFLNLLISPFSFLLSLKSNQNKVRYEESQASPNLYAKDMLCVLAVLPPFHQDLRHKPSLFYLSSRDFFFPLWICIYMLSRIVAFSYMKE